MKLEARYGNGSDQRNDFKIFNSLLISLIVSLLHLRLVDPLLLIWVHAMLDGGHHRLLRREFVHYLGLPYHLRLLLLQGLWPVDHLLAHVQLLRDLLH